MSDITVPVVLLEKVAQFIELASKENEALTAKLAASKVASEKTVDKVVEKTVEKRVEVNVVPEAIAKTAASTLVEAGLLSKEFETRKAAEFADPAKLAAALAHVVELNSERTPTLGTSEKVAAKTPRVNELAEASKRFAASLGIRK